MLNFYIKYATMGKVDESMLYLQQFKDYCSGGSCYESLEALMSIFDDGKVNNM